MQTLTWSAYWEDFCVQVRTPERASLLAQVLLPPPTVLHELRRHGRRPLAPAP
jgi:hypothetical protein